MRLFGKKRTYLDWAASAPVLPSAELAFVDALRSYGNPSSPHLEGVRAKEILEGARLRIARMAEAKPAGVVFTSGATEANNLVLQGLAQALRDKDSAVKAHVLYLPSAHASVVKTLEALSDSGVEVEALGIRDGRIDLDRLGSQIRPETRLVLVDGVCGETGTRWDTRGVRNVLDAYARAQATERPYLHVDASQMPLALPWDLTRVSADSLSLDAQKVGGIRGIGALVTRAGVPLKPLMYGGGQEHGLRPGTESPALAEAFATALEACAVGREVFAKNALEARTAVLAGLEEIPGLQVNEGREGIPNILNLSLVGRDTDYLVMLLDTAGFAVATKSACETDSADGSRAVLGLTRDPARAHASLRISWGPSTHTSELMRFADALVASVRFQDVQ